MTLGSSASHHVLIWVDGKPVKLTAPRAPCHLPLATIAVKTLNTARLYQLAEEKGVTLSLADRWSRDVLSTDMIRDAVSDLVPPPSGRVSRHFVPTDLEIVRDLGCGRRPTMIHPVFKVEKSDGTSSRFIMDLRELNLLVSARVAVPPMELPTLGEIVRLGLTHHWGWEADATSFFFQLTVPPSLAELQGCRVCAGRGSFLEICTDALMMGSCFAPTVAQSVANLVCRIVEALVPGAVLRAWVDNFLCFAPTRAVAERAAKVFGEIRAAIGLTLKAPPVTSTTLNALGLSFVLGASCSLATEMRDQLRRVRRPTTARQLMQSFGRAMWGNFAILHSPLCRRPTLLEAVREVARSREWDKTCTFADTVWHELRGLSAEAADARLLPVDVATPTEPYVTQWSDASDDMLAAVRENDVGDEWVATAAPEGAHIFVKEMLAVALGAVTWPSRGARLAIDNTAAAAAIIRGHSGSPAGDLILRFLVDRLEANEVCWVPTEHQRADSLTRGRTEPGPRSGWQCRGRRVQWRT